MTIQIGNDSKQGKICIKKQIINMVGAISLGHGALWTSSTSIRQRVIFKNSGKISFTVGVMEKLIRNSYYQCQFSSESSIQLNFKT